VTVKHLLLLPLLVVPVADLMRKAAVPRYMGSWLNRSPICTKTYCKQACSCMGRRRYVTSVGLLIRRLSACPNSSSNDLRSAQSSLFVHRYYYPCSVGKVPNIVSPLCDYSQSPHPSWSADMSVLYKRPVSGYLGLSQSKICRTLHRTPARSLAPGRCMVRLLWTDRIGNRS
jgi:hypothetical protein